MGSKRTIENSYMLFQRMIKRIFSGLGYALFLSLSLFILFVFAETGSRVLFDLRDIKRAPTSHLYLADLPVFYGHEWRWEVFREYSDVTKYQYRPYYVWSLHPYQSATFTVDSAGKRKVLPPPRGYVEDPTHVFLFGGSTMVGMGVPDAWAIPSLLQDRVGGAYRLYNFATPAFVAEQSLHRLVVELARGNIPDVVIFYDGINDACAGTYSPAEPWVHQYIKKYRNVYEDNWTRIYRWGGESSLRRLLQGIRRRIFGGLHERVAFEQNELRARIPELAKQTLEAYEGSIEAVRHISDAYGFETYFFWQPVLFWKRGKTPEHEQREIEKNSPVLREGVMAVYAEATGQLAEKERVYVLADMFEEVDQPLYWDWAHLGPLGNELVAERIHETLHNEGVW